MVLSPCGWACLPGIRWKRFNHEHELSSCEQSWCKGNWCMFYRGERNRSERDKSRQQQWHSLERLRPSVCRTILQSLSIGALISLLAAIISGAEYILISYLCYETINVCEFEPQRTSIPLRVQWMRTIVIAMAYFFLYNWFFSNVLLLFRFYVCVRVCL